MPVVLWCCGAVAVAVVLWWTVVLWCCRATGLWSDCGAVVQLWLWFDCRCDCDVVRWWCDCGAVAVLVIRERRVVLWCSGSVWCFVNTVRE